MCFGVLAEQQCQQGMQRRLPTFPDVVQALEEGEATWQFFLGDAPVRNVSTYFEPAA